jgi:hypothetical protein
MYAAVSAAYGEKCQNLQLLLLEHRTYEVVKLNGGDTLVDTRDDLLRNCSSVNMLCIESVTKSGDTSSNLVELDAFLAPVCILELAS